MFEKLLLNLLPSLKRELTTAQSHAKRRDTELANERKRNKELADELATIQMAHAKILALLDKEFPKHVATIKKDIEKEATQK